MTTSGTQIQARSSLSRSLPAGIIGLTGVVLGVLAVRYLITHPDPAVRWAVELLVVTAASVGVAVGAYRVARSAYDAADLWVILGWCLAGGTAAALLGVGLYGYQVAERAPPADPLFLLESIALVGLGVGFAFGTSRQTRLHARADRALAGVSVDPDAVRTLLDLLGSDGETLRYRWDVAAAVADTTTCEVPIPVLVNRLADNATGGWPDDQETVRSVLTAEVFPALIRSGVLEVDTDAETVAYVGPEAAISHLSEP